MLEFQEGFFEQEVRDGFYLDVTIKTLWASEMELLQKIAEVCDKYGLKWYAAYGTLLGAIRHEGFVPWDDDMDIWMMRKDYNKLMEVLQYELPEGYRVRSPQTSEGYDQFHTCVNNGNGISIAAEWLENNHNCPFTVGIDIFPLDYLPRNKKDRELQKSLFTLVGRVAQVAKNIGRGDYDGEDAPMTKKEAVDQVKEGLRYLKKNYKFNLEKQWLMNEEWDKITSEVWKWGNYVAMMYGENEADEVVEYLDWVKWYHKRFPKGWFSDGYYASFENFMLPIPKGYHEILSLTYGDYMHYKPRTGFHEYPYYARQLRQLREYIRNVEKQAIEIGLCEIDDAKVEDVTVLPTEWERIIFGQGENKKKVLLFTNSYDDFYRDPVEALQELRNVIQTMKAYSETIVLWWRPLEKLTDILKKMGQKYVIEYLDILNTYKTDGWGICDETVKYERAASWCDFLYGGMNAIIQTVQNMDKPIIVNNMLLNAMDENKLRKTEQRAFINYSSYVEHNGKRFFSCNNFNAFVIQNIETGSIESIIPFPDEPITCQNLHILCTMCNEWIIFLPYAGITMHTYNVLTGEMRCFQLADNEITDPFVESWSYFINEDECFLLPNNTSERILCFSSKDGTINDVSWWNVFSGNNRLKHGKLNSQCFFSYEVDGNKVCITDIIGQKVITYTAPNEKLKHMIFDGTYFWYSIPASSTIIRWDYLKDEKEIVTMDIDEEYWEARGNEFFVGMFFVENRIILIPQNGTKIYSLDTNSKELKELYESDMPQNTYTIWERTPVFRESSKFADIYFRNMDSHVKLCKEMFDCNEEKINVLSNELLEEYEKKVLMKRHALLHRESGKYDLESAINYLLSE